MPPFRFLPSPTFGHSYRRKDRVRSFTRPNAVPLAADGGRLPHDDETATIKMLDKPAEQKSSGAPSAIKREQFASAKTEILPCRSFVYLMVTDNGNDDEAVDVQCASREMVRKMAMKALPAIAADEIPRDGNHQIFTVVARDDRGEAIYTATLSFVGHWLKKDV